MPRRAARPPVSPAPDRKQLQEAALAHLSLYSATRVGLIKVLERKVERWARAATAEAPDEDERIEAATTHAKHDIAALVDRLAEAGAVSDERFATGRANRLMREGKSRAVIAAHLVSKGVAPALANAKAPNEEDYEVGAALSLARRRRLGPFARETGRDRAKIEHERGILARSGFSRSVTDRALSMSLDEAEAFTSRLRHA